jgi:nicotinate-nucleotide adenylyltransferase
MRIGIFGGSFDPIHLGHLILAEQAREQARLEEVWFIPSAIAPHKRTGPVASDRQRLEMVQLAIAGHSAFHAKDIELNRGGTSYTVDTLESLSQLHPNDEFFLLMGGDSLDQFRSWREPERICQLATPFIFFRHGSPQSLDSLRGLVSPERFAAISSAAIVSRLIEISSTDIRQRAASGRSLRYLVPRSVEMYIENQKLYRDVSNQNN